MSENNAIAAKNVYDSFCTFITKNGWEYKSPKELVITFGVNGDDLPMDFISIVDEERQLLRVLSSMPFTVPEDRRFDMAVALCVVNDKVPDGVFTLDMESGDMWFKLSTPFENCQIGAGLFDYFIFYSSTVVDEYNDKLFALAKGMISLQDLIQKM